MKKWSNKMPAKGQSCQTCNGHCCYSIIGYMYPKGVKKDLIARHKRGEIPEWSPKAGQEFSHKELLAFGMLEVALPETKDHCSNLINGRCILHGPNKPRLCASYWCHGRLWQRKDVQTTKSVV